MREVKLRGLLDQNRVRKVLRTVGPRTTRTLEKPRKSNIDCRAWLLTSPTNTFSVSPCCYMGNYLFAGPVYRLSSSHIHAEHSTWRFYELRLLAWF
jgi:hypothetical protein